MNHLLDLFVWLGGSFIYLTGASYTFTRLHRRWTLACYHANPNKMLLQDWHQHFDNCWHIEKAVVLGLLWPLGVFVTITAGPPLVLGNQMAKQAKPFREMRAQLSAARLEELEKECGLGDYFGQVHDTP